MISEVAAIFSGISGRSWAQMSGVQWVKGFLGPWKKIFYQKLQKFQEQTVKAWWPVRIVSTMSLQRLYLNRTNGKDNHIRLRTISRMIGEDSSKPNLNPNSNPINPKPNPNTKPNPKKRNLEKGRKTKRKPSEFELQN